MPFFIILNPQRVILVWSYMCMLCLLSMPYTLDITAIGITNGVHSYMLDIPSSARWPRLALTGFFIWFTGKGLPFDGYTLRSV